MTTVGHSECLPLGGQWTQKEKAIAQDAWQGKCCTAHSKQWCKDFGIVPSSRYNLALYGSHGSLLCARFWVSKVTWLYDMYVVAGCPRQFVYAREPVFQEPREFTEYFAGLHNPRALERIEELRALFPHGTGP